MAFNAEYSTSRGKFSSRLMEEIVGEFTLQAVLPIHPVSVVVVHPINDYMIDLSFKCLRKAFRTRKHWGNHSISSNAGSVQDIKSIKPILYWWGTGFE